MTNISTAAPSDGYVLVSSNGTMVLAGFTPTFNIKNYGAKGDGIQVFDGAMTGGSGVLHCNTSQPFKATDVGKSIVVVDATNVQAVNGAVALTGTFAVSNSVNPTHVISTNDQTNVLAGGSPFSYVIYFSSQPGVGYQINSVSSGLIVLRTAYTGANNGAAGGTFANQDGTYQQLVTTIASYQSASQVTLTAPATANVSATRVLFATDDTAALQQWCATLQNSGGRGYLPPGIFGFSQDMLITASGQIEICGSGIGTSVLADLRVHNLKTVAPVDNSYGLLSIINSNNVYLHDFTVQGAFPGISTPNAFCSHPVAPDGGNKVCIYAAQAGATATPSNFLADRVQTSYGEYGCISGQAGFGKPYDNWTIRHCRGEQCPNNCWVYNASTQSVVAIEDNVTYNVLGSIVQIGGSHFRCVGNIGYGPGNGFNIGASLFVIDAGGIGEVLDNYATGYNITAGVGFIDVFSASYPSTARHTIARNKIVDCTTNWDAPGAAGFLIRDYGGSATIFNNEAINCGRSTGINTGGKFIGVYSAMGTTGANIAISSNSVYNSAGLNMQVGVHVGSTVPAGMNIYIGRNFYSPLVITPIKIDGYATSIDPQNLTQIIAGTGSTNIEAWPDTVRITANGSVTVVLPDAVRVGAGKKIFIKNASTQAGITTVSTTNSQKIDGASSESLEGSYVSTWVQSNGTDWDIL